MSFELDITKFVLKSKINARTVVRRIAFDAYSRVTKKTPVDTGRARANWLVGINSLPKGYNPTSTSPIGASNINKYEIGDIIYIANNLPYIGVLEYGGYPNPPKSGEGKTTGGFSTQAPQGMVGVTMMELQTNLRTLAEGT